jgi:ribonuclease BN (tRNA processing enzyme)
MFFFRSCDNTTMELTILGTGGPIPMLNRGGTALAIRVDGEPMLVDCGPKTVYGLIEAEIDPSRIRNLFFTHHHVDHNASFFHFVIVSWTLGRESLRIYGPDGTETLSNALETIYAEDIAYRRELGYPADGITDIGVKRIDAEFETRIRSCRVRALPVQHSIPTFAYRFETDEGHSIVFSGDTGHIPEMVSFSQDADVLVHDTGVGPVRTDIPTEGLVWTDYTEPMEEDKRERLETVHSNASQCGAVAREAGVETLVLTHLLPYRDTEAMLEAAAEEFDGQVIVGYDGFTLSV